MAMIDRRYVSFKWLDAEDETGDHTVWDADAPLVGEVVTLWGEGNTVLFKGVVSKREWEYYPPRPSSGPKDEWGVVCWLEPIQEAT